MQHIDHKLLTVIFNHNEWVKMFSNLKQLEVIVLIIIPPYNVYRGFHDLKICMDYKHGIYVVYIFFHILALLLRKRSQQRFSRRHGANKELPG